MRVFPWPPALALSGHRPEQLLRGVGVPSTNVIADEITDAIAVPVAHAITNAIANAITAAVTWMNVLTRFIPPEPTASASRLLSLLVLLHTASIASWPPLPLVASIRSASSRQCGNTAFEPPPIGCCRLDTVSSEYHLSPPVET